MAKTKGELRVFAPALALLVIAVLINYVDRGNLALAAPLLTKEWGISPSQLGILFSAFFWSYMSLQFLVGWLVDRFNVNTVMALGFLVWSLSTAATGLATGFAMLVGMRLLLGVGESVMFPASSKICAQNLPEHSRGFANGLIVAAIRWGSATGTLGGGIMIARYGWRMTFIAVGLFSLLWIPAWMRWNPGTPVLPAHIPAGAPSFVAILRQRSFWGAATGHFCGNYILYFLISWLPFYLVEERHLSMSTMVGTATMLYAVDSFASVATGWVTDRCIKGGDSPTVVRKSAMVVGFGLAALATGACAFSSEQTYLACLIGIALGSGISNSGTYTIAQTLAGPRAAGRWVGVQNGIANLSGIVGPAFTGFVVQWTGHFGIALGVAAMVMALGGAAWVYGVHKVEPVEWPAERVSFV